MADIPPFLLCALSGQLMAEPVLLTKVNKPDLCVGIGDTVASCLSLSAFCFEVSDTDVGCATTG